MKNKTSYDKNRWVASCYQHYDYLQGKPCMVNIQDDTCMGGVCAWIVEEQDNPAGLLFHNNHYENYGAFVGNLMECVEYIYDNCLEAKDVLSIY